MRGRYSVPLAVLMLLWFSFSGRSKIRNEERTTPQQPAYWIVQHVTWGNLTRGKPQRIEVAVHDTLRLAPDRVFSFALGDQKIVGVSVPGAVPEIRVLSIGALAWEPTLHAKSPRISLAGDTAVNDFRAGLVAIGAMRLTRDIQFEWFAL